MKQLLFIPLLIGLIACNNNEPTSQSNASEDDKSAVATDNSLTSDEAAEGWTLLFDGTSTAQWRGYLQEDFPSEGWTVKDGELKVSKGGGDLITKEKYSNVEFSIDYKIETEGGNGGIFYMAIEAEGEPIYHNAPEYQILDNEYHTRDVAPETYMKHLSGDNYDLHASAGDFSNPIGEWNTAKIKINERKVTHWLNGKETVSYELGSEEWKGLVAASKFNEYPGYGMAKEGHIGLQDHNNAISFKNIKVRKL